MTLFTVGRLNVAVAASWGLSFNRGHVIVWWLHIGALVVSWWRKA